VEFFIRPLSATRDRLWGENMHYLKVLLMVCMIGFGMTALAAEKPAVQKAWSR
jgi:hypothetical protein